MYYSIALLFLTTLASAQNLTQDQLFNAKRTLSIGIIIYPGFQPLDVYGPLSILYQLSRNYRMTLSTISHTTGPISTVIPPHLWNPQTDLPVDVSHVLGPSTLATHTFSNAPALDMILVPGGVGQRYLFEHNDTAIENFLINRFDRTEWILSVCSGAIHLARAGILNGRKATSNKAAWSWVTGVPADPVTAYRAKSEEIGWVPTARWVENEDGKVWTSSGVAAGMDMIYAWLRRVYGDTEVLKERMNSIEYAPHTDAHWDPFSVVHKVPGAEGGNGTGVMESCVKPVGY